jgi:hypothetical protein
LGLLDAFRVCRAALCDVVQWENLLTRFKDLAADVLGVTDA